MHRGNVAGDGTKANFHLFKLGWRESEKRSEGKLWCSENDNNNLKVSLRRVCAPLAAPHPLLVCPLPLNTTAQWLPRTRWALCVCWGNEAGRGSKLWHLGPRKLLTEQTKRWWSSLSLIRGRLWEGFLVQNELSDRWSYTMNIYKTFMDSGSSPLRIKMNNHRCFSHKLFCPPVVVKRQKKANFVSPRFLNAYHKQKRGALHYSCFQSDVGAWNTDRSWKWDFLLFSKSILHYRAQAFDHIYDN